MKTSSWRAPSPQQEAVVVGGRVEADLSVLAMPTLLYIEGMPEPQPVALIGGLQLLLDCIFGGVAGSLETKDGELLIAVEAGGKYTTYKEGLGLALQMIDSYRVRTYRGGYEYGLKEAERLRVIEQAEQLARDAQAAQELAPPPSAREADRAKQSQHSQQPTTGKRSSDKSNGRREDNGRRGATLADLLD